MPEAKIDYRNNAAERIKQALKHPDTSVALSIAAIAQAEATLALAEQQRIANLIAAFQMEGGPYKESNNWAHDDEDANMRIRREVREGLGL